MVRDAHSELEKAINNCVQNVIHHVEKENIPQSDFQMLCGTRQRRRTS